MNRFRLGLIILIALIFGVSLVTYAVTYTVQFSEAAVVTRFGKVSTVRDDPGLGLKAPYPIGGVTKYDRRNRILTTTVETVQTADDNPVVVEAFCIWNISDAQRFFARFSNAGPRAEDHYDLAQETLESRVRNAMSHISAFTLEDLFTADTQRSRLGALEERLLAQVTAGADRGEGIASDGVDVTVVGISSIELPESVTERVFDRMRAERAQLVKTLESDAESRARSIRARATADAEKIRSFANSLAAEIEAKGERESAEYIHQMAENADLAIFLANLEFLRTAYAKRATLVLSTATPGFMLMNPDLWRAASATQPIPGVQWDGRYAGEAAEPEGPRRAQERDADERPVGEPVAGGR